MSKTDPPPAVPDGECAQVLLADARALDPEHGSALAYRRGGVVSDLYAAVTNCSPGRDSNRAERRDQRTDLDARRMSVRRS